jgi:hypothetical protein
MAARWRDFVNERSQGQAVTPRQGGEHLAQGPVPLPVPSLFELRLTRKYGENRRPIEIVRNHDVAMLVGSRRLPRDVPWVLEPLPWSLSPDLLTGLAESSPVAVDLDRRRSLSQRTTAAGSLTGANKSDWCT